MSETTQVSPKVPQAAPAPVSPHPDGDGPSTRAKVSRNLFPGQTPPLTHVDYVIVYVVVPCDADVMNNWAYLEVDSHLEQVSWLETDRTMSSEERTTPLHMKSPTLDSVFGSFVFHTFARVEKG